MNEIDMKFEKGINTVIEEMMGFSLDSDKLTKDIIKYIEDELKAGNINRRREYENSYFPEVYTLTNYVKDFSINGKKNVYSLKIGIINFPETMENRTIRKNIRSLKSASCMLLMGDDKQPAFEIEGFILYKNWKLTNLSKSTFQHEIKHAYTHIRKLEDKDIEEYMSNTNILNSRYIYAAADEITGNNNIKIYMPDVYNIAVGIYISDTDEIASFTQQAYTEMENATSFSDVDRIIRKTQIYHFTKFLDDLIEKLEGNDDIYNSFISVISTNLSDDIKLPTKHLYIKMLKKRAKKYKSNVGKVIVYTKDRLREDALKEGYNVPVFAYDTNWSEVYKLGLY